MSVLYLTAQGTNLELIMGIADIVGILLTVTGVLLDHYVPASFIFNTQKTYLRQVIRTLDTAEQYGTYSVMGFTMFGLNQEPSWCGRIGMH